MKVFVDTQVSLPLDLVEELKVWQMAFTAAYGKEVSLAEMIVGMLESLDETEPGVVAEMDNLLKIKPELRKMLGKYSPNQE